jgi:hypothetical protein
MHDVNGTPLKVGDKVFIPATITELQAHPDLCNASVRPLSMRGAEGREERMTVNTAQLLLVER